MDTLNTEKFSPFMVGVKKRMKVYRLIEGLSLKEGAKRLGVSLKKLGDLETTKAYGAHVELEMFVRFAKAYNRSYEEVLGETMWVDSEDVLRPRKHGGHLRGSAAG